VSSPGPVIGYEDLVRWIDGPYAALRARVRLQPAGGPGDKVFPPTYEERLYAQERRLVDGRVEDAVLLDSVASQANRMELALLAAADARRLTLPLLWPKFYSLRGVRDVDSLQVSGAAAPRPRSVVPRGAHEEVMDG